MNHSKVTCVHLFNDFSGSPRVLSTVIKGMVQKGLAVEVITSDTTGCLSNIDGVQYDYLPYRFFDNKLLRLFMLLYSQWVLFFKIFARRKESGLIYINTLLPFGAALAGKLGGQTVIYHLHETSVHPLILKRFLQKVGEWSAQQAIYVSSFLMEKEQLKGVNGSIVYNALSEDFVRQSQMERPVTPIVPFRVIMLCSLKVYKGVNEFLELARMLPHHEFVLVLNTDIDAVRNYFEQVPIPDNLTLFPAQSDTHDFYRNAHLVLNLSDPDRWVETFGMTLLEAMQYGLPTIAPPVGGPIELVTHNINGYQMDARDLPAIKGKIELMASNRKLYQKLSANALKTASSFSEEKMVNQVVELLQETTRYPIKNQQLDLIN